MVHALSALTHKRADRSVFPFEFQGECREIVKNGEQEPNGKIAPTQQSEHVPEVVLAAGGLLKQRILPAVRGCGGGWDGGWDGGRLSRCVKGSSRGAECGCGWGLGRSSDHGMVSFGVVETGEGLAETRAGTPIDSETGAGTAEFRP
jgi:hypothetical protein